MTYLRQYLLNFTIAQNLTGQSQTEKETPIISGISYIL